MTAIAGGMRLSTKALAKQTHEVVRELARLKINASTIIYATFVDDKGVSVYVKRGGRLSDIAALIPNGQFDNWMSYFDAGTAFGDGPNAGYAASKHQTRRFPADCV